MKLIKTTETNIAYTYEAVLESGQRQQVRVPAEISASRQYYMPGRVLSPASFSPLDRVNAPEAGFPKREFPEARIRESA